MHGRKISIIYFFIVLIPTTLLYLAVLPPDERVHGEAPRRALPTPSVPAVVGRVAHLWEDCGWRGVGVGVRRVPWLALQPSLGTVCLLYTSDADDA